MAKKTFSITEAIKYGWRQGTSKLGFFILIFLIVIAANAIPALLSVFFDSQKISILAFASQLIGWGLQLTVSLGLINVALRIFDKKKSTYKDLFKHTHLVIPYFLGSIVYSLIVIAGFILLIVPGIVWSIKFRYFSYIMVDRNIGPIDALKESAKITQGVKWKIVLFGFALFFVNLLGLLCLGVGLLVTIPLSVMAEVYVYRKLSTK